MTEEKANYLSLEQQTRQLEHQLQTISTDPATSHWLKRAVTELWERDVVDALNDLDVLRGLLEEKQRIHAGMLKQMVIMKCLSV